MSGLPFMPWCPARFLSATRGWSVTVRGIYRELLDAQWEAGGLPASPAELQRLIAATSAAWKCWPAFIARKFPVCDDGLRRNPTLEEHRAKSIAIRERNRIGAAKTNAQVWGGKGGPVPIGRDIQMSMDHIAQRVAQRSDSERRASRSAVAIYPDPSDAYEGER